MTFVDMDAPHRDAGEVLAIGDHGTERMSVERVVVQGLDVQHEPAAPGAVTGVATDTLQPNS
jgi:hypothetical protein